MRSRFDDNGNPDLRAVVDDYRAAMKNRMRLVGPGFALALLALIALTGFYTIEPGWVGVVRTFGQETSQEQPGLNFRVPLVQSVDKVNLAQVRRAEIGFRSTKAGPKRVDSEALMLTGDENIVEAQMIVQYRIREPSKYLFRLKDPEKTLHIAAEVALRGVVGQTIITSNLERTGLSSDSGASDAGKKDSASNGPTGGPEKGDEASKVGENEAKDADKAGTKEKKASKDTKNVSKGLEPKPAGIDASTDILTTGREQAQISTKKALQELLNLYESGIEVTEVKLQAVDAPDEVKDAFHDVVRAREEREQKINKALGYREDQIPRARGEAQKVLRAAEAYKKERVLRAEGEAKRFISVLEEYRKAKSVTRERLHLEVMERILSKVERKVLIDKSVAGQALPLLSLDGNTPGGLTGGR